MTAVQLLIECFFALWGVGVLFTVGICRVAAIGDRRMAEQQRHVRAAAPFSTGRFARRQHLSTR